MIPFISYHWINYRIIHIELTHLYFSKNCRLHPTLTNSVGLCSILLKSSLVLSIFFYLFYPSYFYPFIRVLSDSNKSHMDTRSVMSNFL